MKGTKRITILSILTSQALVLSIVESMIPLPVAIPGIKLGLANIITLIVIALFGYKSATKVVIVRVVLSSIYSGSIIVFWFSLIGGLLSTLVMGLMYHKFKDYFSLIGISVSGAIFHNMGQLFVAVIVMKELSVISYAPFLLFAGIIMGGFTGLTAHFLLKALKKILPRLE